MNRTSGNMRMTMIVISKVDSHPRRYGARTEPAGIDSAIVSATEKMETEVVTRNDLPKSFDAHAVTKLCHCSSKIHTGGSASASRCVFRAVRPVQTTGARNTTEVIARALAGVGWSSVR